MNSFNLLFVIAIISFASCADNSVKSTKELNQIQNRSFETNGHDTINLVDHNGLKQGIWKPSPINTLKAMVVYKNDTIIK